MCVCVCVYAIVQVLSCTNTYILQVFVGHQSVKRGGDMVFTVTQTESWLSSLIPPNLHELHVHFQP